MDRATVRQATVRVTLEQPSAPCFDELYRAHYHQLVRLAFLLIGSEVVAQDVVHDVFVRCASKLPTLAHPESYLRRCTVNECRSVSRWWSRLDLGRKVESSVELTPPQIELRDALVLIAMPSDGLRPFPGLTYDPATRSWSELPDWPTGSELLPETAVWTGSEILVWGLGFEGGGLQAVMRWSPGDDSWQVVLTGVLAASFERLDDQEQVFNVGAAATWTGAEMVIHVWWTRDEGTATVSEIVAIDPSADGAATRSLGRPPADDYRPRLLLSGQTLLVVGEQEIWARWLGAESPSSEIQSPEEDASAGFTGLWILDSAAGSHREELARTPWLEIETDESTRLWTDCRELVGQFAVPGSWNPYPLTGRCSDAGRLVSDLVLMAEPDTVERRGDRLVFRDDAGARIEFRRADGLRPVEPDEIPPAADGEAVCPGPLPLAPQLVPAASAPPTATIRDGLSVSRWEAEDVLLEVQFPVRPANDLWMGEDQERVLIDGLEVLVWREPLGAAGLVRMLVDLPEPLLRANPAWAERCTVIGVEVAHADPVVAELIAEEVVASLALTPG